MSVPNGLGKEHKLLHDLVSFICQKPSLRSRTVKMCLFNSLGVISSRVGIGKFSSLIFLFKCCGSRHNLRLLSGFSIITILLSQSVGCLTCDTIPFYIISFVINLSLTVNRTLL